MDKTYIVYFDNECQCELTRFEGKTHLDVGRTFEFQAWLDSHESFGGGNYNYYSCVTGWKLTKVTPRNEETGEKMTLTLEEE